jgi:hypothetical protein
MECSRQQCSLAHAGGRDSRGELFFLNRVPCGLGGFEFRSSAKIPLTSPFDKFRTGFAKEDVGSFCYGFPS